MFQEGAYGNIGSFFCKIRIENMCCDETYYKKEGGRLK